MVSLANRRSSMVLYADPSDPLGHAVRIVLAEKALNYEINYTDIEHLSEEIKHLNPYNQVLTLIDRDLVLYDAETMMEYLDERFPHPPLMPVDPVNRASHRQFRCRVLNDLLTLVIPDFRVKNSDSAFDNKKILRDNLTAVAPVFQQYTYFMSNEFTLVDCCLVPILWRLNHYQIKLPSQAKPILKYAESIFERPAFKASLSSFEKTLSA